MIRPTNVLQRTAAAALLAFAATATGCCTTPDGVLDLQSQAAEIDKVLDAKQEESLNAYAAFTESAESHIKLLLEELEATHLAQAKHAAAQFERARELTVLDAHADYQRQLLELLSTEMNEKLEASLRSNVKGLLDGITRRFRTISDSAGGSPTAAQIQEMQDLQRKYRQIELLGWREELLFREKVAELARTESAAILEQLRAESRKEELPPAADWRAPEVSFGNIRDEIAGFRSEIKDAAHARTLARTMVGQYLKRPSIPDLVAKGLSNGVSATISDASEDASEWISDKVGDKVFGVDIRSHIESLGKSLDAVVQDGISRFRNRIAGDLTSAWQSVNTKIDEATLKGD